MALAHKAPHMNHKRAYTISAHAIERFRERAMDKDVLALDDWGIGNVIDATVRQNDESTIVIDTRNSDTETQVARCRYRDGAPFLAVIRDKTVVTILDIDMLATNVDNGSWRRKINSPFTATALAGVVPVVETTTPPIPERAIRFGGPGPTTVSVEAPDALVDRLGVEYGRAKVAARRASIAVLKLRSEADALELGLLLLNSRAKELWADLEAAVETAAPEK